MKDLMADKKFGFYVTLGVACLAIITAFVYLGIYNGSNYMSFQAFYILLGGVVLALVLSFFKFARFAPAVLFAAFVLATMFFIYGIYFFISSALVGIQYSGLPPEFIVVAALFVIGIVASLVNVFLPQTVEE